MKCRKVSCLPGFWQGISWVAVAYLSLIFYLAYVPLHSASTQAVLISCNTFLTTLLVIFGVLGTFLDPSDPVISQERLARLTNTSFDRSVYTKICTVCETHVNDDTKHCTSCDTCVMGFDHHCKWLNNCIGSLNYRYFITLIAILQTWTAFHFVLSIILCYRVIEGQDISAALFGGFDSDAYLALVLVTGSISFAVFIVNGHLIGFHIWLTKSGLSTYDFILRRRELKKQKSMKVQADPSSTTPSQPPAAKAQVEVKSNRSANTLSNVVSMRGEVWESDQLCTEITTYLTEEPLNAPQVCLDNQGVVPL